MAIATLLNAATPGPALATATNSGATAPNTAVTNSLNLAFGVASGGSVAQVDTISLTAGTWLVTGIYFAQGTFTGVWLNLLTATGSDSWPTQLVTKVAAHVYLKSAVIKVAATTTVFLNGESTMANAGMLMATQID